jgi:GcrA cell cycle regulator
MEWTDATIARLRVLWDEGHSTAEIGHMMGVSKNAIVGKAHRLGLKARPSPIRRDGAPRAPRAARVTRAATLAPLASIASISLLHVAKVPVSIAPSASPSLGIRRLPGCRTESPAPQLFPPTRVTPPARPVTGKCLWPLWGHFERPTHKYCDAPSSGRWCNKHCELGYEKRQPVPYQARWDSAA